MPVPNPVSTAVNHTVITVQQIDPRAAGAAAEAAEGSATAAGASRKRKAHIDTYNDAELTAGGSSAGPLSAPTGAARAGKKPRAGAGPADASTTANKGKAAAGTASSGKQPALAMIKCKDCEYTTPYTNTMARHSLTHSGDRPFACRHCSHRTNDKSNLQVTLHTTQVVPRPYYWCWPWRASNQEILINGVRSTCVSTADYDPQQESWWWHERACVRGRRC